MVSIIIQIYKIIMQNDSNTPPFFCYLNINNFAQFIAQIALMGLSLLLVGDAFRKFYKMRGSHNKHVTFVYRLLLFWWITYVVSNSYGLVLYQLNESNSEKYSNEQLSVMSKYYFAVDWINAFSIQWLLLYLPYQWAKQISLLFDNLMSDRESVFEMEQPAIKYQGYQTKIYKTLKFYMFLRLTYLAMPVVFIIVDNEAILFKIMITSLLIDCIVIAFSLIIGMVSLKTTQQLKEQLDEQQSKRTFNQYLVFIFANTIRFVFDLKHVINRVFSDDIYVNSCPDTQEYNVAMSMTLLVCTCLLTFYLPVFIILRIYNLQDRPEQMCESLIISKVESPNESFAQN